MFVFTNSKRYSLTKNSGREVLETCSDQMTPLVTSRKLVSSTTLRADRKLTPWMVPPGMPLAATLKSQMLRLLRRSKSTRSNQAMVIPNKRYSAVIPESPAVIVERAREREASRNRSYSHSQARRHSKVRGFTFRACWWRWWKEFGRDVVDYERIYEVWRII